MADEPLPARNSRGNEIWWSSHLENGEVRPELRGLSTAEYTRILAEHAPDLTADQKAKLAAIFCAPRVRDAIKRSVAVHEGRDRWETKEAVRGTDEGLP